MKPKLCRVLAWNYSGQLSLDEDMRIQSREQVRAVVITEAEYRALKKAGNRASRAGLKGGPARALSLSPEKRQAIARKAARVRWGWGNAS